MATIKKEEEQLRYGLYLNHPMSKYFVNVYETSDKKKMQQALFRIPNDWECYIYDFGIGKKIEFINE